MRTAHARVPLLGGCAVYAILEDINGCSYMLDELIVGDGLAHLKLIKNVYDRVALEAATKSVASSVSLAEWHRRNSWSG
jgi:hypothetical protein